MARSAGPEPEEEADSRALSVVVPAWNEASGIGTALDRLHGDLPADVLAEVVVVDDGSSDATVSRCRQWMTAHPAARVTLISRPHRGKGAAVLDGALATRGELVAYIDADMEVPPRALADLLHERERGGFDVVVAVKRFSGRAPRPFTRRMLSAAFSAVAARMFDLPVRDTQTGCKVFDGPWLRRAAGRGPVRGLLFDLDLLGRAAAEGLHVGEVLVPTEVPRRPSRIRWIDVAACVPELAGIYCRRRWARARGAAGAQPARPRSRRGTGRWRPAVLGPERPSSHR